MRFVCAARIVPPADSDQEIFRSFEHFLQVRGWDRFVDRGDPRVRGQYEYACAPITAVIVADNGHRAKLRKISCEDWVELANSSPVSAGYPDADADETYFLVRGQLWICDDVTSEQEGFDDLLTAAAIEHEQNTARKLHRARMIIQTQASQSGETEHLGMTELPSQRRREPIPKSVRMFVWQRDGGRCTDCGTNEELEFDHIIPLVMGGSNTERNLQLLCGPCNRVKGGNLV